MVEWLNKLMLLTLEKFILFLLETPKEKKKTDDGKIQTNKTQRCGPK